MKHAFAPHLAGLMLPGIFTYFVGRKPRFPGDPWPDEVPAPSYYWMHADGCNAGLYRSVPARREPWNAGIEWLEIPAEMAPAAALARVAAPQAELFEVAS